MTLFSHQFDNTITTDALEILESQHREIDKLFETLRQTDEGRGAIFAELANKLAAHTTIEEKVFYPAVVSRLTVDLLHESVEEHLSIKRVLADMIMMRLDDDTFRAKLVVLQAQVSHHARNEEEAKLFPSVRAWLGASERAALGLDLLVMFEDLIAVPAYMNVPSETKFSAALPSSSTLASR